jgi:hypothetical protein
MKRFMFMVAISDAATVSTCTPVVDPGCVNTGCFQHPGWRTTTMTANFMVQG